jgi:ABC-2 type transport system ATP-binding protein
VDGARLSVASDELIRIATQLAAAGIEVDDIALRRPTLDEVFLHLTGGAAA